eukprot:GILK01014861.1.p1 GENE.GILK01014861.1~~GILK01014861.1.p1  ORF type:complete len:433 (+),score=64.88 GILK01014861.1:22-1299(+)
MASSVTDTIRNVVLKPFGGNFSAEPESVGSLGEDAIMLILDAFSDISPSDMVDHHTHVLGLGAADTGCYIHESHFDFLHHPVSYAKAKVVLHAGGVKEQAKADQQYIQRLLKLIENCAPPGSDSHPVHYALALDQVHDLNGQPRPDLTSAYVPNDYIHKLTKEHGEYLRMACSIHPYRPDAITELDRWAAEGVRLVKWNPSSMMIDMSNPICYNFYARMVELDMALLVHTGSEFSLTAGGSDDRLSNPLLLRPALDRHVKIIAAHCAAHGKSIDFEADLTQEGLDSFPMVENFELFLRLMREEKYEELLFGDLSALALVHNCDKLLRVLENPWIHNRLVNGSDYPLPAVNLNVMTTYLVKKGLLSWKERSALNQIYSVNPLLFDYVLKRTVRHPQTQQKFARTLFKAHPFIDNKPRPHAESFIQG